MNETQPTPEQVTSTDEIKALIEAHSFTSAPEQRGHLTVHRAVCACGAEFDWKNRYFEHERHQMSMVAIWSDARAAAAKAEAWDEAVEWCYDGRDSWTEGQMREANPYRRYEADEQRG